MYAALWRVLPGPWWVRVLILLALATAVVAALMTWVFPVVSLWFAPENVVVD